MSGPFTLFSFGMVLLVLATVYTFIGRVYVRFSGWVYRADEPKRYRFEIAMYYLAGMVCIVLYLVKVGAFSD